MLSGVKRALFAVSAASMIFGASAAMADDGEKTYIIACDAAYAPFSWEQDGKYVGIDVEVLDAVAKASGFSYELKPMNFEGVIPGLISGQLDGAIAGMNINEERRKILDFSDGYFDSGLSVIVKEDSKINTVEDLKGTRAAVKKGTTGALFVESIADEDNITAQYYTSSPETMMAVKNGYADFLCEDYPVIAYQIKIGVQKGLRIAIPRVSGTPQYGFGVKKGTHAELIKMFNDGLKTIKENGTYDKIVGQYL